MTELMSLVGIALCGMAVQHLLEALGRREMALLAGAVCGAVMLGRIVQPVSEALNAVAAMAQNSGLPEPALRTMIRIAGMALLAELSAQLCRDAGTGALAQKIELAGKGMILCAALPMLDELAGAALQLLQP